MKAQQENIMSPLNDKKIEIVQNEAQIMGTYEMQEVIEESETELGSFRQQDPNVEQPGRP